MTVSQGVGNVLDISTIITNAITTVSILAKLLLFWECWESLRIAKDEK